MAQNLPNIIWLTLDSVRTDHTTLGGYHRDTTPHLRRIADSDGGTYYSRCFAPSNGTPISSASMLTGTYPTHHGLNITNEYLPDELATVPELLGEVGYETACVSRNSYLSSGTGLDRGFDRFKWIAGGNFLDTVPKRTALKFFLNIRRHSAGLTTDTAKYATPFLLNDIAKRWLDDLAEPHFLYLHYNEPHRPYYPPLPYLDRFTDDLSMTPGEAAERALEIHYDVDQIIADGYTLDGRDERALLAMYDAEIAYTDACVGALFDYIQSRSGETIFIVTADHGELFGEHGLLSHKFVLNDAVTHVPLLVHGLDTVAHQKNDFLQHIDLVTTLLENVGATTEQCQGINLHEESRNHVICQAAPNDFAPYLDLNPDFDADRFHSAQLSALRTEEFKYQYSDDREELFELPDETTDRSEAYPDIASRLRGRLLAFLRAEGEPIGSATESNLSDQMQEQLRDLGYHQ